MNTARKCLKKADDPGKQAPSIYFSPSKIQNPMSPIKSKMPRERSWLVIRRVEQKHRKQCHEYNHDIYCFLPCLIWRGLKKLAVIFSSGRFTEVHRAYGFGGGIVLYESLIGNIYWPVCCLPRSHTELFATFITATQRHNNGGLHRERSQCSHITNH